ncbi:MAG: Cyanophycinase [Gemmatimonadetes bacterium]|jgi:cyanophycinase|nr:Cyanophycinase [Gemmatimonadota bacterium]
MDARRKAKHFRNRPLSPSRTGARGGGSLVIIGGHEDRTGEKLILREVASRLGEDGKIVVCDIASSVPDALWEEYEPAFRALGVPHVFRLSISRREEASEPRAMRILEGATGVFFTGGDQLKITSQLGDTPVFSRMLEIFEGGGVIAGTSAGASVMSETMMVQGGQEGSHKIKSALLMAPGFGLARDMLIDQHFAERGRMARLIGAVSQNPRMLGIGIDEDTAIIVEQSNRFDVLGEGAVYIVDASTTTYSNIGEEESERTLSSFGLTVHMLSQGDHFDLATRTPTPRPAEIMEKRQEERGSAAADD